MNKGVLRTIGAVLLAVGLVGCTAPGGATSGGGGGSAAGGEGLPETVRIMSIRALTGPVSFAGTNAQRGIDLAADEIRAQGILGDSELEIDVRDSAASAQEAASFASQAVADPSYSAVIGPEASAHAVATSPIVQQAGLPIVYVQSGSDGVLIGDYTFRMTPPAASYFDLAGDWVEQQGARTASVLYATGNPTLVQLAESSVPNLGTEHGFSVLSSIGFENTNQDFTAAATQIAGENPDVVFLMLQGPQDPTAITQLRQAGYQGEVVGMSAMGAGNLTPAGDVATGAVWPTNFTAGQSAASSQAFVEAFTARYGEAPTNYSAEAYDALWFLARGIAEANSGDRAAVRAGLATIAGQGFDGAQGPLTFDGTDARVTGTLVRWDGSGEVPVENAG